MLHYTCVISAGDLSRSVGLGRILDLGRTKRDLGGTNVDTLESRDARVTLRRVLP